MHDTNENLLHFCLGFWLFAWTRKFDAKRYASAAGHVHRLLLSTFIFGERRCTHTQTSSRHLTNRPKMFSWLLQCVHVVTLFHFDFNSISVWFHFHFTSITLALITWMALYNKCRAKDILFDKIPLKIYYIRNILSSILILSHCLDNNRFVLFDVTLSIAKQETILPLSSISTAAPSLGRANKSFTPY